MKKPPTQYNDGLATFFIMGLIAMAFFALMAIFFIDQKEKGAKEVEQHCSCETKRTLMEY